MIVATFWKSDFVGDNLGQLRGILKQYAVKGIGCWFEDRTNSIQACLPGEEHYNWIMEHVANYGNPSLNR